MYRRKGEGGSGIGLSTVRGIVEQYGGWIEVQSTPGEGATFRVTLPVGAAGQPVDPARGLGSGVLE